MKTVVILGGAGAMSSITIADLLNYSNDIKVTIADISIARVEERLKQLSSERVSGEYVNLDNKESLIRVVEKADLVINCALSKYNLSVMEVALELNKNYMDFSALPMPTLEQMKLDKDFRKANLAAVIGMGVAPGISNLMARYAYDNLDRVESVRFRFATKSFAKSTLPIKFPWSAYALLGQLENKSILFDNGELKKIDSLTGDEYVQFSEPIGTTDVVYLSHPEPASMSVTFSEKGVQFADMKMHMPIEFRQKLQLFWDLGFASSKTIKVGDTEIVPREIFTYLVSKLPEEKIEPDDCGCFMAIVTGVKGDQRQEYTVQANIRSQNGYDSIGIGTGIPMSIAIQMLFKGEITKKGVFPPDVCINPKVFFKELAKRNIYISYQVKKFIS